VLRAYSLDLANSHADLREMQAKLPYYLSGRAHARRGRVRSLEIICPQCFGAETERARVRFQFLMRARHRGYIADRAAAHRQKGPGKRLQQPYRDPTLASDAPCWFQRGVLRPQLSHPTLYSD
jgi:hypothetical protein